MLTMKENAAGESGFIAQNSVLDQVLFKLSATRTRCEVFAVSGNIVELVTSGLLKPFVAHIKAAEEQVANGAYIITLEPPRNYSAHSHGSQVPFSWFTKATLERVVRFVQSPELLERILAIDVELMHLNDAIRADNSYFELKANGENPEQYTSTSVLSFSDSGRRPALYSTQPPSMGYLSRRDNLHQDMREDSSLIRKRRNAHEFRHSMLRREQGIAFARATSTGFLMETIPPLIFFSECFGALRLREACMKFVLLVGRSSGGEVADDASVPGSTVQFQRSSVYSDDMDLGEFRSIPGDSRLVPPFQPSQKERFLASPSRPGATEDTLQARKPPQSDREVEAGSRKGRGGNAWASSASADAYADSETSSVCGSEADVRHGMERYASVAQLSTGQGVHSNGPLSMSGAESWGESPEPTSVLYQRTSASTSGLSSDESSGEATSGFTREVPLEAAESKGRADFPGRGPPDQPPRSPSPSRGELKDFVDGLWYKEKSPSPGSGTEEAGPAQQPPAHADVPLVFKPSPSWPKLEADGGPKQGQSQGRAMSGLSTLQANERVPSPGAGPGPRGPERGRGMSPRRREPSPARSEGSVRLFPYPADEFRKEPRTALAALAGSSYLSNRANDEADVFRPPSPSTSSSSRLSNFIGSPASLSLGERPSQDHEQQLQPAVGYPIGSKGATSPDAVGYPAAVEEEPAPPFPHFMPAGQPSYIVPQPTLVAAQQPPLAPYDGQAPPLLIWPFGQPPGPNFSLSFPPQSSAAVHPTVASGTSSVSSPPNPKSPSQEKQKGRPMPTRRFRVGSPVRRIVVVRTVRSGGEVGAAAVPAGEVPVSRSKFVDQPGEAVGAAGLKAQSGSMSADIEPSILVSSGTMDRGEEGPEDKVGQSSGPVVSDSQGAMEEEFALCAPKLGGYQKEARDLLTEEDFRGVDMESRVMHPEGSASIPDVKWEDVHHLLGPVDYVPPKVEQRTQLGEEELRGVADIDRLEAAGVARLPPAASVCSPDEHVLNPIITPLQQPQVGWENLQEQLQLVPDSWHVADCYSNQVDGAAILRDTFKHREAGHASWFASPQDQEDFLRGPEPQVNGPEQQQEEAKDVDLSLQEGNSMAPLSEVGGLPQLGSLGAERDGTVEPVISLDLLQEPDIREGAAANQSGSDAAFLEVLFTGTEARRRDAARADLSMEDMRGPSPSSEPTASLPDGADIQLYGRETTQSRGGALWRAAAVDVDIHSAQMSGMGPAMHQQHVAAVDDSTQAAAVWEAIVLSRSEDGRARRAPRQDVLDFEQELGGPATHQGGSSAAAAAASAVPADSWELFNGSRLGDIELQGAHRGAGSSMHEDELRGGFFGEYARVSGKRAEEEQQDEVEVSSTVSSSAVQEVGLGDATPPAEGEKRERQISDVARREADMQAALERRKGAAATAAGRRGVAPANSSRITSDRIVNEAQQRAQERLRARQRELAKRKEEERKQEEDAVARRLARIASKLEAAASSPSARLTTAPGRRPATSAPPPSAPKAAVGPTRPASGGQDASRSNGREGAVRRISDPHPVPSIDGAAHHPRAKQLTKSSSMGGGNSIGSSNAGASESTLPRPGRGPAPSKRPGGRAPGHVSAEVVATAAFGSPSAGSPSDAPLVASVKKVPTPGKAAARAPGVLRVGNEKVDLEGGRLDGTPGASPPAAE